MSAMPAGSTPKLERARACKILVNKVVLHLPAAEPAVRWPPWHGVVEWP
jgi:hypothetical protein